MKLITVLLILGIVASPMKFDFGKSQDIKKWIVINDGVMGGLSTGEISYTDSSMIFKGSISLENNGGFASVRTSWGKWDLSKYSKIKMRVKTNGRKHSFVLETDKRFYKPSYKQEVTTEKGEWKIIELPIKDFNESVLGKNTGKKISDGEISKIIRMGFILFDKQAGDFSLEVDYIELI